ncbi:MAG: phosphatidylinositol-3-phosphatase [Chloroflexota bacterium]|nr:phosphatidylinositol-3-phosphatase [Chloroflexota bacterium]
MTSSDRNAKSASRRRLVIAAAALAVLVGVPPAEIGRAATASVPSATVGSPTQAASPAMADEPATASPSSADPTVARRTIPNFRHIYVIVMENREYGTIVGNSSAPYINSLIARYGLATNYRAVAHPSQPNYIALFSGSTQGVKDNGIHSLARANLVDQLTAHGISWRVFAQNVPAGCYKGATAHGGPDGSGTYARKHEPAISFTSIARRPVRCARIRDFSHFSPSIADFELIVPNMCNSMHDCSTATGDSFLRRFVPRILRSPAMQGSVLFLTWDEGTTDLGGGGRIATVVIGPTVKRGYRSATPHTHYSLLRTVETAWGLGCLNRACAANDLREFFR